MEDQDRIAARMAALRQHAILDTDREAAFDDAVALVRTLCDVPIALVSLVDRDRQWFKARVGVDFGETPIATSVCAMAIAQDGLFVIPDLTQHPRTRDMALVTPTDGIRFYAGAPLVTADGIAIGSLCAIDTKPRPEGLTAAQAEGLAALGRQVSREIAGRLSPEHHSRASEDAGIIDAMLQAQRAVEAAEGDFAAAVAALGSAALRAVGPADGVVVETLDGDEMVYRLAVGSAAGHDGLRLPVAGSLSGLSLREGRSLVIADTALDPRAHPSATALGMRSMIVVPLVRRGVPFGVLKLHARRPSAFGPRHTLIAQALAGLVAARFVEDAEARAVARVEASEQRYADVVDSAVDTAIVAIDGEGIVTSWSKGAEAIYGWHDADMIGRPIDRLFTPEDCAAGMPVQEMRDALARGNATVERWQVRRDGSRFFAHCAISPLKGDASGFVKSVRDISREHATRGALAVSRERLDTALATGLIGFFEWDVPGDDLRGDARFADFHGVDEVSAREGRPVAVMTRNVHPADRDRVRDDAAAAARAGRDYALSFRVTREGRSPRWLLVRGSPIDIADGGARRYVGTAIDVTVQREAEEKLRLNRERLELATKSAGLGSFDYLPQAGTLDWDDRCRALFGIAPGRPVTYEDSFLAGLHPQDRERAHQAVAAALDPAGTGTFDTEYRTIGIEDGIERFVVARGLAFFDGDRPVRLIGTVLDVSDSRREQAALRETEERLRYAVRATNDAIWDWDLIADDVLWNEALESAYGHAPADVAPTGAWWIDHIHPDDRARIYASIHDAIDGDATDWTAEYRFRRADGSHADVRDRGFVIRDGGGRAVRMLGAMLDQSERKAIERRLAETVEARTQERDQIWTTSPDLLCVAGLDGWLRVVNPAWTATLGWSEAELTARPFIAFVHPEDRDRTTEAMAGLADGRQVFDFENRYATEGGGWRWLSWNAVPRDGAIYAVVRDVTVAHDQASALARAEDQLRQSQKMEAVGQLTGGLAHDFNNLLAGISGSIEMTQVRLAQGRVADVDRYLNAAMGATKRAAALTHRLLAFSRRQTLAPGVTDANRLVQGMEDLVRRTVGPGVTLEIVTAGGLWTTLVDPNQLENALLNLCINARDAMPGGGTLTVETANRWLDERAAAERDLPAGQYVSLCVSDTGTGMTRDVIARAFDPFFTTKPIGQGTGLGLSMIYGFARQSDGQVRIYSEVGQGTTVCLYLPRHLGPEQAAALPAIQPEAPRAAQGETVLVVDDEPTVRMLVTDALEELGYAAIEAGDGAEGLAVLRSAARIDLLITDVGLPGGMNGRQLADAARGLRPALRILFITGYAENAVLSHGHLDPGMEVLTKPFAMDTLGNRIRTIIEG